MLIGVVPYYSKGPDSLRNMPKQAYDSLDGPYYSKESPLLSY